MTSIFSITGLRSQPIGCLNRLCKISKGHNVVQVAFMKRLALKEHLPKPAPYPYWKKYCNSFAMIGDPTSFRYDENTRLIIVDGPPAIGKTKFCEKIAEEFGLLYMPAPVHDEIYINTYGFDIRELDSQLPPVSQTYDLKRFLADPMHVQVPQFQLHYLGMRVEQYQNALLHALATGQGVVLNRSFFSDIAFVYAMHYAGYLTKDEVLDFEEMHANGMNLLMKPHLVIYLDAPPDVVLQKIKQRGNPDEVNSKVFTTKYLSDLDRTTKDRTLAALAPHSEILSYDWSKEGNYDDVVQDIESLDLEGSNKTKFHDWVFRITEDVIFNMSIYQEKKLTSEILMTDPSKLPPRMKVSDDEYDQLMEVLENSKAEEYSPGYNIHYGDNVLFAKERKIYLSTFRRTPRDFVNFDISKIDC